VVKYLIYDDKLSTDNNVVVKDESKNIFNDLLVDDENFKWKLHATRMLKYGTYTKTTWIQHGRFRFDIEYYSDQQFFYIFCRYDNNNREYNNGTNRTVTLNQIKVHGNDNLTVYKVIEQWKEDFVNEIKAI
jgi:hypothetical protein